VDGGDDERSTVALLHVGGMHFGPDQQAGCVSNDMPLAAVDFLGHIEATRAAGLGGFDRLAIDNTSRGAWLASRRFARLQQQIEITQCIFGQPLTDDRSTRRKQVV
jgi:hypothetical protein